MNEFKEHFAVFDEVEIPDLWDRINEQAAAPIETSHTITARSPIAIAAACIALITVGLPLLLLSARDETFSASWTAIEVDISWESVANVTAIPSGGFVALVNDPAGVLWSPDGVEWFDADPQHLVAPVLLGDGNSPFIPHDERFQPALVAATSDTVFVLDRGKGAVWSADPGDGSWEMVDLALNHEAERVSLLTIAANEYEALVFGQVLGPSTVEDSEMDTSLAVTERFVSWTIDSRREAVGQDLPIPTQVAIANPGVEAAWFDGRWLAIVTGDLWEGDKGWNELTIVITNSTGTWTALSPPIGWGSVTSITGGPDSAVVTTCHFGGDSFWYVTNDLEWMRATNTQPGHRSAYVEDLGFVIRSGDSWVISTDGSEWRYALDLGVDIESYPPETGHLIPVDRIFTFGNRLWIWSTNQP